MHRQTVNYVITTKMFNCFRFVTRSLFNNIGHPTPRYIPEVSASKGMEILKLKKYICSCSPESWRYVTGTEKSSRTRFCAEYANPSLNIALRYYSSAWRTKR